MASLEPPPLRNPIAKQLIETVWANWFTQLSGAVKTCQTEISEVPITLVEGGVEFGSDPPLRLVWLNERLCVQVFKEAAWHTCIKGGY